MKTLTHTVKAWLPDRRSYVDIDCDSSLELLFYTSIDMSGNGYIHVGEATITVRLETDRDTITKNMISGLRGSQQKIRAQAEQEINEIEQKIQNLLAITYEGDA